MVVTLIDANNGRAIPTIAAVSKMRTRPPVTHPILNSAKKAVADLPTGALDFSSLIR
jgi:hypothetical protein